MDELIAAVYVVKYSPDQKKSLYLYKTTSDAHTTCLKITDSGKISRKLTITSTSATMKAFSSLLMSSCHQAVVHFVHNALIAF